MHTLSTALRRVSVPPSLAPVALGRGAGKIEQLELILREERQDLENSQAEVTKLSQDLLAALDGKKLAEEQETESRGGRARCRAGE